ncbi:glucans biosynthesis glucosyltransferase MdoH [Xanthobacter versatilis]|uniref:glucans biosynthesis glucosyltransferase MdoH n=1 Tax=Xanthobacter autotrophicus (strain ATCC BAA-1158 / Py2) TaxID=78245 RepID=UPI00372932A3
MRDAFSALSRVRQLELCMSSRSGPPPEVSPAADFTPALLQPMAALARRRMFMLVANALTLLVVLAGVAALGAHGGFTIVDGLILLCALAITPWNAIGFWNAMTGLVLLHARRRGVEAAAPFLAPEPQGPLTARTAILLTVRNEDPARALARLRAVKADLDASGHGALFDFHVLSDTSRPEIAAAEEAAVAAWRSEEGASRIFYRRRTENTDFKAGNIRDFCLSAGARYDFMLPLDADSLMGASTILRMARLMAAHPRLGILQSLVVGLPAKSAFARMFQFGMRHGMRCYTLGASWWAGECGPFWGHNALIRIAPFRAFCHLPHLPGAPPLGGPILSHDQVEAALMRRAGYEVRVLPVESESYEENPPAVTDFVSRDLRWCLGNLQYLRLLAQPGFAASLKPMSRFQLVWAILMFVTVPAHPLLIALLPFAAAQAAGMPDYPAGLAIGLYGGMLLLALAPKLAGVADVALTPGGVARYGGAGRFAASVAVELVFSFLLSAITALAVTMEIGRLLLGRARSGWMAQARDGHGVSWGAAARAFWPQTVFGLAVTAGLAVVAPVLILWAAPVLAGYVLAIPFTVATADPRFARFAVRTRLCAVPEEFAPTDVQRILSGESRRARVAA